MNRRIENCGEEPVTESLVQSGNNSSGEKNYDFKDIRKRFVEVLPHMKKIVEDPDAKIIAVKSRNCDHAVWTIPGNNGHERCDVLKMMSCYVSIKEGKPVETDDLPYVHMHFFHDDPKDQGKHDVPGTVMIAYKLKED